jgi:hypothetical protein
VIIPSNKEAFSESKYAGKNITLEFPEFYSSKQPPHGLKKFTQYVDTNNGNPVAKPTISRFQNLDLTTISSEPSDNLKAKLTSSLLSGYTYCFFPGLVSAMQGTCAGSCDTTC